MEKSDKSHSFDTALFTRSLRLVSNRINSSCRFAYVRMNILIIGINYAPEIIGTAVYTSGMATELDRRGMNVQVVTAQPYYPDWKVFKGHSKFGYQRHPDYHQPHVTHCPHYVPANPSGVKRILHHMTFAITATPIAIFNAFRAKPDVVICIAPALMSAPLGWLVARLRGAKCWLHIQDFEVEAAFATGLINADSLAGRIAGKFERWLLARFDKISTISKPMMRKLHEKGIPDARIFELRNWADLSKVTPMSTVPALKAELGIKTKYVALYSGNIANKQGIEIIPQAAKRLAHRKDLTFLICGKGPFLEQLKETADGLENVKFAPLQPLDRLSELLGLADVHLLPQIAGAEELVLPSKLTNMLASGRPVVATTGPDTALAEEIEGCGIVVPPADEQSFANAIDTVLADEDTLKECGANAHARALDRWNGTQILDRLSEELKTLAA